MFFLLERGNYREFTRKSHGRRLHHWLKAAPGDANYYYSAGIL